MNLNIMNENENTKSSDDSNQKPYQIDYYELSEKDFYPPEDKRVFKSGVEDINNGDNFEDYSKWFYDNYEDELFDN